MTEPREPSLVQKALDLAANASAESVSGVLAAEVTRLRGLVKSVLMAAYQEGHGALESALRSMGLDDDQGRRAVDELELARAERDGLQAINERLTTDLARVEDLLINVVADLDADVPDPTGSIEEAREYALALPSKFTQAPLAKAVATPIAYEPAEPGAPADVVICPRCGREAKGWPLKRGDRCSPSDWVSCIRDPDLIRQAVPEE
jgi:hypothetical protein